jgi:hypothetical protein
VNTPMNEPAEAESTADRRDDDGLPLDRDPTIDDVRGNDGSHRALAIGCSVVVLAAVLGFWLLRVVVLR